MSGEMEGAATHCSGKSWDEVVAQGPLPRRLAAALKSFAGLAYWNGLVRAAVG